MATRWRMPASLGGGEYECVANGGELSQDGRSVAFDLPDLDHIVWLPKWILTKVEPPPVEEPPPGYYLIEHHVLHAMPYRAVAERVEGYAWYLSGHSLGYTWDELVAKYPGATFTRLVPEQVAEPVAEPVALPWQTKVGNHTTATVYTVGIGEIGLQLDSGGRTIAPDITSGDARRIARALMAAADLAEKEQS